jgi:hypothetical protein
LTPLPGDPEQFRNLGDANEIELVAHLVTVTGAEDIVEG